MTICTLLLWLPFCLAVNGSQGRPQSGQDQTLHSLITQVSGIHFNLHLLKLLPISLSFPGHAFLASASLACRSCGIPPSPSLSVIPFWLQLMWPEVVTLYPESWVQFTLSVVLVLFWADFIFLNFHMKIHLYGVFVGTLVPLSLFSYLIPLTS